ncbi:DUF4385 domain-containing protein [Nitrosomonas supralitoralis]|uniref:DUF4385 domain-containing protein n=1 Tax=Nitrosomonas supralitoralis TaxID=2116706 RepID=A0A2P7NYB6_9PROT|nr:DUF4385 domain-containing protein [Nitrosomonas supralitoralis]PSJ18442.1 DUF4385 domain-containing protein [Nitrosomonas supralitoralis]
MTKKNEMPSYLHFDKSSYAWRDDVNYRNQPEEYRVGKGEQDVLICEPYKSEIGQHWRFKTANLANESSTKIYNLFNKYLNNDEFVGADMARKYLQMGFTRARRYANYQGGKKYNHDNNYEVNKKGTDDPEKAISAEIFYAKWKETEANEKYKKMKKDWKKKFG